ncbi:MAG: hypothetical protein QJT81_04855 [Candidatus Thiothrix putei]|uniref:Uncharacterized protein n=1 Tax=Candidatus Thiothrix putei TaxID=3080811 RepID=A0AA95HHC2_9GAMM|nr:MAG: hypothetical protein QJT81_04855 [Candidatus Thiothrix putei]
MTEQLTQTSSSMSALDTTTSANAWGLAKKRANDYLKLHSLPEADREQLLARITDKLARAGLFTEQELIQLFISTAQEELALMQATNADGSCCQCKKPTADVSSSVEETENKTDNRTNKTGPRFERSSIRVAPLQAITLLPSTRK